MLDIEFSASREHKSSVFAALFSEPQATIELYNAVTGRNYPLDTKVEIVTLSNVLFNGQLNDVAFVLDGKLVVLMEHQSTLNKNMPLRMLIYMSREYELMTNEKDLYKEKLIEIPAPEFIVLYNGKEEFPDFKEFKLSDSYKIKDGNPNLELIAKVYNINKGRNADIINRSQSLKGYSELVAEVNKNRETMKLADAITAAVRSCMERKILVSFLKRHGSEVFNMLFTEWNLEDAIAVRCEEVREDARKERDKDREELFALWESGVPLAEAKKKFGLN